MANDLNYRITVDQSAGTAGIRDFSRQATAELRKVDKGLEDTETASKRVATALAAMADQAESELKSAGRAADALASALGPEFAAKLGRNGIAQAVGDFNRMGLTFEQVEADADALAASMKRLDQVQTSAAEQGLGNLSGKLNETEGAATGAKSALANMVGNTAQDVSALGGNMGSLGVAIGQMAEYASDAALDGRGLAASLGSMAAVAGPIAGLALVMQTVQTVMANNAESAKRSADDIEAWSDALEGGGDAARNYAKALGEAGEILVDNRRELGSTKATLGDVAESFDLLGRVTGGKLPGQLGILGRAFGLIGDEATDIVPLLARAGITAQQLADAARDGAPGLATFEAALAATSLSADEQAAIMTKAKQSAEDYATATENAAAANVVFGASADPAAMDGIVIALLAGAEAMKAEDQAASDAAESTKRAGVAADQAARFVRNMNDEWSALTGQLDSERAMLNLAGDLDQVRQKGQEAWDAAVTGAADAEEKQRAYQQAVIDAKQDVITLGKQVGLSIPEVKRMQLEIDNGNLEDVERQLDIMARNRTMNLSIIARGGTGYGNRPGTDAGGIVPGLAPAPAGRGLTAVPAADAGDAAAAASPAAVPDLTFPVVVQATSPGPTHLTLDMRGAILGSRYDIVRTVRSATRDGIRLAGTRGITS